MLSVEIPASEICRMHPVQVKSMLPRKTGITVGGMDSRLPIRIDRAFDREARAWGSTAAPRK